MILDNEISIVVQGAINKDTHMCLKSIRKHLPKAQIILSTWEESNTVGLDCDELILNKDVGAFVHDFISNTKNNFNRQLLSTKKGLERIERKYCLKLRSDLILHNVGFLKYWDEFSVQNSKYKIFNHKVICDCIYSREKSCFEYGNSLPTPFHPTDFWFFGLSEDLKDYFLNCPMQTKDEASNWAFKYPNRLPYSFMLWRFAPEQFFCVNWVKKYYPDLKFDDWSDWNLENIEFSNNILYNNFIFLDYERSGIFSEKHSKAIKNQDGIQGLITYEHFQKQYRSYCDSSYQPNKYSKKYEHKLKKHFKRFIAPFLVFKSWIFEVFSILYYGMLTINAKWQDKND